MIITFTTETGSRYEVNTTDKQARRVTGIKPATNRQGDGWKSYEDISDIVIGKSVAIFWDPKTTPLLEGSTGGIPATVTSCVVSIDVSV